MALPTSGQITLKDIATELETPLVGFRMTGSAGRNLAGIPSGQITVKNFYGKANIILRTIAASTTDLNLFTLAGSPAQAGKFRFDILSGVTVGQVSAIAAIIAGAFPSGSDIVINNAGSIQGKGGAANGGDGGDALVLNASGVTVTINNTGDILSGGGGGGQGGTGGQGGQGGAGTSGSNEWRYGAKNANGQTLMGQVGTDGVSLLQYGDNFWAYGPYLSDGSWCSVVKWNGQYYSDAGYNGYPPIPSQLIRGDVQAYTIGYGPWGPYSNHEFSDLGYVTNVDWRFSLTEPVSCWGMFEATYVYVSWDNTYVVVDESVYAPGWRMMTMSYKDPSDPNIRYIRGEDRSSSPGANDQFVVGRTISSIVATVGGLGGIGGLGGNGGRGCGYDGNNASGAVGSAGQPGAAGGLNAGAGGSGGTGGTGGPGGGWGSNGSGGAMGNAGSPGANGNNGYGQGGTTGQTGTAGGRAGKAIVKGSSTVTINNSGSILGAIV